MKDDINPMRNFSDNERKKYKKGFNDGMYQGFAIAAGVLLINLAGYILIQAYSGDQDSRQVQATQINESGLEGELK